MLSVNRGLDGISEESHTCEIECNRLERIEEESQWVTGCPGHDDHERNDEERKLLSGRSPSQTSAIKVQLWVHRAKERPLTIVEPIATALLSVS